jgi:low affinity Fe/Cu permease
MLSRKSIVFLYALPFIISLFSYFFQFSFINEVTGNNGIGLIVTGILSLYFIVITLLAFSLKEAVTPLLSLAILALMFLPVRQNISVVSTLKSDSKIYWIERSYFTSFLSVHKANNEIITKPERVRLIEDVVYEAQLKAIEGEVYLVYKENENDPDISEKI